MKIIDKCKNGIYLVENFKLFGFIELFKKMQKSSKTKYYFLYIPILKIIKSDVSTKYKLFSFIPLFEIKSKKKNYYDKLQCLHNKILLKLQKKAANKQKIRVGFYIIEVFQYVSLYEEMLKSDFYEPFIVVVPDVSKKDTSIEKMLSVYDTLKSKYTNVFVGYDTNSKKYVDFSNNTDIAFFGNPYQSMAHDYHFIWHMLKNNVLTCYQNYAYNTVCWGRDQVFTMPFYNSCWKIFTESAEDIQLLQSCQAIKGKNAYLTGYCKMDKLADVKAEPHKRKRILLCPHHTINFKHLQLSNFLRYSDFFLELPKKYPDIDFIWRPHQLLINSLSKYWSKEEAQAYYDKITSYPNVIYSTGQDYFQTFIDSDAMIHDCGSFTAEYLFTGKPCCYMLKSIEEIEKTFVEIGQKCLENYYKSFNEADIYNFIEKVVISGEDPLKDKREKFSNYLKLNYPNVGKKIAEYIKEQILNTK